MAQFRATRATERYPAPYGFTPGAGASGTTNRPGSSTSRRDTDPAASTVPYSIRTGPATPPCPPRKIGAWSSITPRGTSPISDAVALSPCGV